jgi:hypothetical protein
MIANTHCCRALGRMHALQHNMRFTNLMLPSLLTLKTRCTLVWIML